MNFKECRIKDEKFGTVMLLPAVICIDKRRVHGKKQSILSSIRKL